MATKRGPRFKECRRLGVNVYGHPKAMKRANAPAFAKRKKVSEYGAQLMEKQKIKGYYGILENQLRRYFAAAQSKTGKTGDVLMSMLECRLDNIVYRVGIGGSIRQARQLVTHGHILVNGKKITIPSYQVKVSDTVRLKEKTRTNEHIAANFLDAQAFSVPYIEKHRDAFGGTLLRLPEREEIPVEVNDSMVIEFYSR